MGKDLKGKELGTGLRQRKDGRYEARAKINGLITMRFTGILRRYFPICLKYCIFV